VQVEWLLEDVRFDSKSGTSQNSYSERWLFTMIVNNGGSEYCMQCEESKVVIFLDDASTRMCLKYHIDPLQVMLDALSTEIHNKATIDQKMTLGCPFRANCKRFD
jgi:hypothetical protein